LAVRLHPPDRDFRYAIGILYEAVGAADRALTLYDQGLGEERAKLSAGRFLIGMLRYRQDRWPDVIAVLSPLKDADDASLIRIVSERFTQKATWRQALLVLGEAYEKTNAYDRASEAYERLVKLQNGAEPWIVNRGLVGLANIHAQQGDVSEALRAAVMAVESCYTLPLSYKRQYAVATCRSVSGVVSHLIEGRPADFAAASRRLNQLFPRRAAAWYVEAQCDRLLCRPVDAAHVFEKARTLAGGNAATLIPPGEIVGVPGCTR
jgi:tetratricopeptide (TPR) repeat protein